MPLTADTHVSLARTAVKKDATVGTGALTLAADNIAVKIGSALPVNRVQSYVGLLRKCFDLCKSNLHTYTGTTVFSIVVAGTDSVVTTGHVNGAVSLFVHANFFVNDESHDLDRTFKRVIERLLEEAK